MKKEVLASLVAITESRIVDSLTKFELVNSSSFFIINFKIKEVVMLIKFLSFVFVCGFFLCANPSSALSKEFIGVAKCKMCHNKPATGAQYAAWAASPHAKAFQSLKGDDAKNPKCLKCHSTAFGLQLSETQSITVEEGVSCESCHGAGSEYKTISVMKDQTKAIAAGLILPEEQMCRNVIIRKALITKSLISKRFQQKLLIQTRLKGNNFSL